MHRIININEEALGTYEKVSDICHFGKLHPSHPRFVKLRQGHTTLLCMEKSKVRIMGKSQGEEREKDLEKLQDRMKIQLHHRRISNIVVHVSVSPMKINLEKVGNLPCGRYEPETLPAAAYYGKATVYYSGKIEVMGSKSLEEGLININETLLSLISNNCFYG